MTKLTTTFNLLKRKNACIEGYKKLAKHLGSVKSYGADKEINLLTVLESNGFNDAVWCLQATKQDCENVKRLIAVGFAESVLHIFESKRPGDNRPRSAIKAAKDYANGLIGSKALATARQDAYAAYAAADAAAYDAYVAADAAYAAYAAAYDAADAAAYAAADAAAYAAYAAAYVAYAVYAAADAAAAYDAYAAADAAAYDAAEADYDAATYDADARLKKKDQLEEILKTYLSWE